MFGCCGMDTQYYGNEDEMIWRNTPARIRLPMLCKINVLIGRDFRKVLD